MYSSITNKAIRYRSTGGCRCKGQKSQYGTSNCVVVDNPIKRPDLAIYSQEEQFAGGNAPTWNSPDILTNNILPFQLMDEAEITIRNLSDVAASNALVHIFTSPFGIGGPETLQLSKKINLAGGQVITLLYPWLQTILDGDQRVGIHILIEHPFDEKKINNYGSQVIDVHHTTVSGRSFNISIPVVNNTAFNQQIQLQLLTTDIVASVTPSTHLFVPFEQLIVTLHVAVPPFIHGTPDDKIKREVTVVGRESNGTVIGGTTLVLYVDN